MTKTRMSFTVSKINGLLIFNDHGCYETRNPSTIWCIKEADKIYNWNDFNEIKIFTEDYEIDYDLVSYDQAISDIERAEKVATGKRINPKRVQEREAARKYVEENPYDDIVNRYGDYNYKDVDYE
jgi:hypothetical protein